MLSADLTDGTDIVFRLKRQKTQTKACRALANTLDNAQARKLNSDDKTLLWAQF